MIDFGTVKSTVKPKPMVIDEISVWVNTDIQAITEPSGTAGGLGTEIFTGYQYHMKQYPKDEYIQMMAEKNTDLEAGLTNTQLALCDVYELLGG